MIQSKESLKAKFIVLALASIFVFVGALPQKPKAPAQSSLQAIDATYFNQLPYRHIGPQGNRMIAVVGVPGDLRVYYAGAASGGIWKSTDGGIN